MLVDVDRQIMGTFMCIMRCLWGVVCFGVFVFIRYPLCRLMWLGFWDSGFGGFPVCH